MPPVVATVSSFVVKAFMAVGLSKGTSIALMTFGKRLLVSAGLSAIGKALTPKPKVPPIKSPGLALQAVPDPMRAREVIYGEVGLAGQPIYRKVLNDNKDLHQIHNMGDGGPYDSFQSIKLDGETVTLDGSGNITAPSKWAGKGRIETKLGTSTQTAFTNAVSEIPEWTSDHRGRGVAMAHLKLEFDPDAWTTGVPTPLFITRGRTGIYDPRLDSSPGNDPTNASYQAWTQNPALWALDYLRGVEENGQRIVGLGIPDDLIDFDSFATAADVCDENVNVSGGGTIKRYTGGGAIVSSEDDALAVMQMFAAAMAGWVTTRSGKISIYAGEVQTATVTLTDDDWAGEISVTAGPSVRDTANAVKVQYIEPALDYEIADAAPYRNSTWETEDGGEELWTEMQLGTVQDHRVAQRLGKIFAGEKREQFTITGLCKIKAIQIQEGEVFTLDSDSLGASVNGKFKLVQRAINPDGTVKITARSEDDAKYSWDETTEERAASLNTINPPTAAVAPTPTGWTASEVLLTSGQNANTVALDLAVSGTIPTTVAQVEIQYKRQDTATLALDLLGSQYGVDDTSASGDSDWVSVAFLSRQQAEAGYRISGIDSARTYTIRVRYITQRFVIGDWYEFAAATGAGSGTVDAATGWSAANSTQTSAEGYTRPAIAVSAPSDYIPGSASVVAIDYRKTSETEFSGQVNLSRADASRGAVLPAEADTDYIVRVRYGSGSDLWGKAQVIPVSVAAVSSLSLASFTAVSNSSTGGSYTFPGIKASWTALSGDDLRRANSITIEYRVNGTTDVSKLTAEPDAAQASIWGVLPGQTYNVRARAEEVYQVGAWTSWVNVTVGSTFTSSEFDGQGALATADTVDLGSGLIRDSGGNNLTDTNTLNASIEVDAGTGQLTNIGGTATVIANNFIGVVGGNITGIGTGNNTAVANSNITLSNAGVLSGGGTSSQIDATQILNGVADAGATAGADWASNLTSRPTELTDGRVSAGLNASGDLNRNITTTRANSSNLLRYTSGGLFTGDLAATAGADWSSNLTNRPTELTDGRVSAGLNASGVLLTNVPNASQIPTLDTSKIGSGTFANARIAQSNVTQHEAAVNALNLTNGPAEASATAGATWGSDITSQPSWSTDDRVPDTISDSEEITKNTKVVQLTSGTASRSLGRAVEFLEVQDGDSITFTTNFGKVPNVRIIGGTGLSFAVASGADFGDTNNQYQAFRATNLTTSGFDVSAKIRQAPTTTAQNDSVASTGTGSEPDLVGQKSTADEAGDDTYRFSGTVSATFTGPAICTIGVYTLDSGTSTWVKRNETTVSLVSGSAVAWSANAVVDGLTQDGGGDQEFGVSIESESGVFSVNPSLASVAVAYDSVSTLTETSATPTGEYVYALVFESDEVLT